MLFLKQFSAVFPHDQLQESYTFWQFFSATPPDSKYGKMPKFAWSLRKWEIKMVPKCGKLYVFYLHKKAPPLITKPDFISSLGQTRRTLPLAPTGVSGFTCYLSACCIVSWSFNNFHCVSCVSLARILFSIRRKVWVKPRWRTPE